MTNRRAGADPGCRAFTLLELMVVISIIAIVTTLVVPQLSNDDHLRAVAASSVIRSDIEIAQIMTISHPVEPVVVRFDPANGRYWLSLAATPETPIVRPDTGEQYLVEFGTGRASGAEGVTLTLSDVAADTLVFDAQGGLIPFTATPTIRLDAGGRWIELHVSATTGTITETGGDN